MSLTPEERRCLYLDTGWEELGPEPCDICGRPDILDGDEPGLVHVGAGVLVCSEACTLEALRRDEEETRG